MQGTESNFVSLFWVAGGTVLALVTFIATFMVLYQRKLMRQQRQLRQQERQHQEELLSAVIESQETERKRLARDLHDDVGATLHAIRLSLRNLSRKAEQDSPLLPRIEEVNSMVDEGVETLRKISREIMPSRLEETGLWPVLQSLVTRLDQATEVQVQLQGQDPGELPPSVSLSLFRICKELMANGLRHAQAYNISLSLHKMGPRLELRYRDDGIGIRPGEFTRGIGMRSMESRLQLLKGSWSLESPAEGGSLILIQVPLSTHLNAIAS